MAIDREPVGFPDKMDHSIERSSLAAQSDHQDNNSRGKKHATQNTIDLGLPFSVGEFPFTRPIPIKFRAGVTFGFSL